MPRKLPDDPVKRRLQSLKRVYQHLSHFRSLMEEGRMDPCGVIQMDTGEEIYLPDLMTGIAELTQRQRQAFELICLQGYTETAARDALLPNSRSSTPIQQYADAALVRMVAAYDAKQAGSWPPPPEVEQPAPPTPRRRTMMDVLGGKLHDLVRAPLRKAREDILAQLDHLKGALSQLDLLLEDSAEAPGKPRLEEMARRMAREGIEEGR